MTLPNLNDVTDAEMFTLGSLVHAKCVEIIQQRRARAGKPYQWNGDEQLKVDFAAAMNPRKKRAERLNEERSNRKAP